MGKPKADNQSDELVVGLDVTEKDFIIPANAVIDNERVTVISQESDPYHKTGDEFKLAKKNADRLVEMGWVKIKKEEKAK